MPLISNGIKSKKVGKSGLDNRIYQPFYSFLEHFKKYAEINTEKVSLSTGPEKSVIKIFYDNDWGWKLVPELASLVLYITGLSGHVKSRRKFPPVLLEIYGLFW